jgi:hypothetical protein
MCACVSLRQRVSGGIASSRKGFYASTNWFWFTQLLVFIHRRDKKNVCTQSNPSFYASDLLGLEGSPHSRASAPGWLGWLEEGGLAGAPCSYLQPRAPNSSTYIYIYIYH